MRRRLIELGPEARELVADGGFALVEALGGPPRRGLEALGVTEPAPLVLELGLLAFARLELVDLAHLPAKEVLALGPAALLGRRGLELPHDRGAGRRLLRHAGSVRLELAEGVEVLDVGRRIGQATRSRAARRCRRGRRELGELGGRAEAPVDVGARLRPSVLDDPPHDELALAGDARRVQLGRRPGPGDQLEERLDLGLVGARSRTSSGRARPPSTSDRASTSIDFPAPVSPVRTLKPGASSSTRRSMSTMLRTVSCASTGRLPYAAPCRQSRAANGA